MSATFIQVLMGNVVFLAKNIVPFRLCYFMLEPIVSQVMAVRATALTFSFFLAYVTQVPSSIFCLFGVYAPTRWHATCNVVMKNVFHFKVPASVVYREFASYIKACFNVAF